MKRGQCFGDIALMYGAKRKASIRCATPCIFASLKREAFKKFIMSVQDFAMEETVEFLKKEPLFQVWSRANLIKLLHSISVKKLYKQKVVLSENERSKYFYLIKDGEFELTKKVVKFSTSKQKREAFIDDEHVRIKDLTHGVQRYDDSVLDERNYFLEGDITGFFGLGRPVPKLLQNSDMVETRLNCNRENFNLTDLHQRQLQA
jgi:CRP-like cAMP-binding protein